MHTHTYRPRLRLIFSIFICIFSLLLIRLFYYQTIKSGYLSKIASSQHGLVIDLEPARGIIYDRQMRPLVTNVKLHSVFANNRILKDKDKAASLLASALDMDRPSISERLNKDKGFIWLARKIGEDKARQIKLLKIDGIELLKESKRFYPNGTLAAHLLGFAGLDNIGLEGIELYYDKYLRGIPGKRFTYRDARRRELVAMEYKSIPAEDGAGLVLTIDEVIQHIAERELDKAFKKYKAKGASIVVMDPWTGEILAMASRPSFDLNFYKDISGEVKRNRAVTDFFEPGSIFKIVTAAAALEEKRVAPQDRFFCENGSYFVRGHTLHDHTPHGWLTFRGVIENSSNIGTVKIAMLIGEAALYKYIKSFGFGEKTGVDLPGEVTGIARPTKNWSGTSITAIPMGQEVAVTPLQMSVAISAVANGGILVKPYITKRIIGKDGEAIEEFKPTYVRRVISEETARTLKSFLEGVVDKGTGKNAIVPGVKAAGKTGTAQKVEPNGTYSHSKFVASFIGFAPADKPRVAIAVFVDEPRPYYFGGVVSAPVFSKVCEETLKYLGVSSDMGETQKTVVAERRVR